VFQYKAFKSGGTIEYVLSTDNIGIDSSNGDIKINPALAANSYTVIVKGIL
jgi:hypothetical protein